MPIIVLFVPHRSVAVPQDSDRDPSMSVATPTLIPRSSHFPNLLPPIPNQREPKPAASRGRSNGRINTHRDLFREMEDLSDEEVDLEALVRP